MNSEIYKGINFIRISTLPVEEQVLIRQTLDRTRIIKILRDKELLSDCVQTHHYNEWKGVALKSNEKATVTPPLVVKEFKFAFK